MNDKLKSQLESILLVSSKPLSFKKLAELTEQDADSVKSELENLSREYSDNARGFSLVLNNNQAQLVSSPENSQLVKGYLHDEITGELTKPSLETLTIIAYRQPITKAEMEQIRGVNCSLILRNLLIRGLIEAEYNKERATTLYSVTIDFLKFLGLNSMTELPDFEKLNSDENLLKLLDLPLQQTNDIKDEVIKIEVTKG